jgi:hypothetical protein
VCAQADFCPIRSTAFAIQSHIALSSSMIKTFAIGCSPTLTSNFFFDFTTFDFRIQTLQISTVRREIYRFIGNVLFYRTLSREGKQPDSSNRLRLAGRKR